MALLETFLNRVIRSSAILLIVTTLTGCAYTNEISRTKQDIEHYSSVDAQTGVVLSMGPGLFHTAGFLAKFVDDEDAHTASRLAYSIRRIKVGIYPLTYSSNFADLDVPELQRFKKKGWEVALKVEDHNEVGWILYRERKKRVRDLFVVVLTESELVLVRVQGNLTEFLDLALDEMEKDNAGDFFVDWGNWEY